MRRSLLPIIVAGALALSSAAHAATTKSFRQATAKDFEEGEAEASMILPSGEVVPGMKASHVDLDAAFVWCSALAPGGAVAYFGTGDEGRIYAVDVGGNGERAQKLATLDAAWVTALAVRPDGVILAGTTPGGRIYTVDPKTGASKQLTTLAVDHVWALAYDAKTGTTYAGTGGPGKVFAIDGKGRAREVWDSRDKHVVSLVREDDRHLLAGTSEEAILYRVGLDGRAEALQDFEAEEVRAVAHSGDALLVAVNDFEKTSSPTPATPVAAKGTRIAITTSGTPASAGSLPRPGQRKSRAALYRLERDGRIEQVFALSDGYFTSLLADGDGGAYVATGTQGRVYRVNPDRTAALAIDLPERQALTLLRAGETFLVGTGDVGGVYRARPAAHGEATYLSRVLDAEWPAHWGRLRWHGSKQLGLETRSGNTARPDVTWSAFQPLAHAAPTADGGAGELASPPARYVQYRAALTGDRPRLDEVTLYYLPQNQRARVTELSGIDGPGTGGAQAASGGSSSGSSSGSTPAAARVHSSLFKLRWKVENPDGDELSYRLWFREQNEAVWRPLAGGASGSDPLLKPELDWNTEGLPDGTYVVRIVTSDERSQPRDRALESTFLSPPILIDNRKPEVVGLSARYPFVSGRARDGESPIGEIEYAIDGGDWQVLTPADGLCDDLVEAFTLKLPALAPGPHAVTIRAWDAADNVGAASITVNVR
jgi:outer membrane protein assembly factor BamB